MTKSKLYRHIDKQTCISGINVLIYMSENETVTVFNLSIYYYITIRISKLYYTNYS
jgi:hypothetical protein